MAITEEHTFPVIQSTISKHEGINFKNKHNS